MLLLSYLFPAIDFVFWTLHLQYIYAEGSLGYEWAWLPEGKRAAVYILAIACAVPGPVISLCDAALRPARRAAAVRAAILMTAVPLLASYLDWRMRNTLID